jgi:hypothetical protein
MPNVSENYPEFQIKPPNETELTQFLIEEKQFDENRVKSMLTRLEKSKKTKPQMSLESFFGKPQTTKSNVNSDKKVKKRHQKC